MNYDELLAQYKAEQQRRIEEYNLEKLQEARDRGLQKREGFTGIQSCEVQSLSPNSRKSKDNIYYYILCIIIKN